MISLQVPSEGKILYVLGPIFEDGYSLCYNPRDEDMFFPITSFRSNGETNSAKFGSYISDALYNMQSILEKETVNIK